MSVCDKNRLLNFVNSKDTTMQNSDLDKLDILRTRVRKEFKKLVSPDLSEEFKLELLTEIERLLTYLNYFYASIPSFNTEENKAFLYLLCKFIIDQEMVENSTAPAAVNWLQSLNEKDYNIVLYENLKLQM